MAKRISGLHAWNDVLVEQFIADENYRVLETGVIMTCIDGGGYKTNHWRRCDHANKGSGYRRVQYKGVKLSAHRIVYRKLMGLLDPSLQINHIDGDPGNNRPLNLELVTQSENIRHNYRVLGYPAVRGRSKINQEIASEIRSLVSNGYSRKWICDKFGICKSTVSYIVNRKSWHSPPEQELDEAANG